jgi:hypothetical protein
MASAASDHPEQLLISDARKLLLELYVQPSRMGGLADRAAISKDNLALSGTSDDAATSLVDEAWKRRRLPALLEVINQDYGGDRAEIIGYVKEARKLTPPAKVGVFRTSTRNVASPPPDDSMVGHSIERPPLPQPGAERGEIWVQDAATRLQSLRTGIDELQVYVDVLKEAHTSYGTAAVLAQQARRFEQLTDVKGHFIHQRSYKDALDTIMDAHDALRGINVSMWVAKLSPPLCAPELSGGYANRSSQILAYLAKLKNAGNTPGRANEIANELTYESKELRVFWDLILQSLYVRFSERLQQMRAMLKVLEP